MVGTYSIEISKADAIGVLPVFQYVANELLANTEFEETAASFARYWANRLAYVMAIPTIQRIHVEIEALTWAVIDQAAEAVNLGLYEREILRAINWDINRQTANRRQYLQSYNYKNLLHAKN